MTEIAQLRQQMRQLRSTSPTGDDADDDNAALEQLRQEMQTLHTMLRKQKGEWVRQLNDALGKIDKQAKQIAAQQEEIDALKRQVGSSNGTNNNNNSKSNSKGRLLSDSSSASLGHKNKKTTTSRYNNNNNNNDEDDDGSESSCELPGLYGHLTAPSKNNNTNSNNNNNSDFAKQATESFMHDSFRPMDDDFMDEGDGDVVLEFDFGVKLPDNDIATNLEQDYGDAEDENKNNNDPPKTPTTRAVHRRASLDSVQTIDLEEPRKKTINILPHKSVQIYNEQRADMALRKLMRGASKGSKENKESEAISVRKVHKKNLVFWHDRIYIPEGLRQATMEYYYKKYKKQTPILHLEKNCYWPEMEYDMKKYENVAGKMTWKVRIG